VTGLSPRTIAAITAVEHELLEPGAIARESGRWENDGTQQFGAQAGVSSVRVPECCGSGPRGALEEAIRYLPGRAKPDPTA